ncbi:sigma-70 family RNA polymerase sigma factor [Methylocella silvestris]|uniref:RNA polymerase sigma factor n=1 Tax=Methylocella silvestris TaxID=199596 RepID=A0A2J7TGY2_METSI|nr:sigma-70 family RNA polymerase sigma factor [Methylocella silvestris]PNG26022.1 RNA polymerase subunit sigma-70 [Methylocella silvestris]
MPKDDASLADLIAATADGDRDAFQALYNATSGKLFAIILRIIRNKSTAEDILQDVYLRVWRNASSYAPEAGPPMAWLNSIARNRTIDVLRRKSFFAPPMPDETDWYEKIASPRDEEADLIDIGALRHCLGAIEEPNRSCVLLAYYEGYSREELAARFDKPVNTIKTWLHRSLLALRACLDKL